MNYPKISIVTPVYNQVQFLETTIQSVLSQEYPNLEYIIIDGDSSDGTLDIIKKYEKQLSFWISEKDEGMYDAINKGIQKSTGEIMGWVNSDDILLPGSLFSLAQVFENEKVNWVQGLNTIINERGHILKVVSPYNTTKYQFYLKEFLDLYQQKLKPFGTLQQESTYWRRTLWDKTGGYLEIDFKLAGDFELWMRFFRHEKLYCLNTQIGAFRIRKQQLSNTHMGVYIQETKDVINREIGFLSKKEQLKLNYLLPLIKKTPCLFRMNTTFKKYYDWHFGLNKIDS